MLVYRPLRAAIALALFAAFALGCGVLAELDDPLGRDFALNAAQRQYTQAIRWGELEDASAYVDPALKAAFLEKAAAFEGFRITDYQIGQIDYDADDSSLARVSVTYRGYCTASLIERPIRERQQWYRESGNDWRVRPEFDLPIGHVSN
jgi:hypothetical protein